MEDKSSNITLKGRNALRPDEIDLKYLIEDCDLVKAIEEHDYDVHVNQLDFTGMNLSYSEKDLLGLFERTDVRSVDKIDELKLIDLSAVGIGLKEKRQGGTERDRYVCLDQFVGCVNDGVDNEREKDSERADAWKAQYTLNREKYERAQCSDRVGLGALRRLRARIGFVLNLTENFKIKKNKKGVSWKGISAHIARRKAEFIYTFTNKVVLFVYRRAADIDKSRFYESLGLRNLISVDDITVFDEGKICDVVKNCGCVLRIYERYLSTVLSSLKRRKIKKAIDVFSVGYESLKKEAINSLETIEYKKYAYCNFSILFERFVETLSARLNKSIDEDIKRRVALDAMVQYVPAACGAIFAVAVFVLSFIYNYTLLKEFARRQTVLIVFSVLTICAIFSLVNLYRNAKKFYRPKRKRLSVVSLFTYVAASVAFFGLYAYFINRYDGYDKTYYYVVQKDGTIAIDGLVNKKAEEYIIPDTIDGYRVSFITRKPFRLNKAVQSIDMTKVNAEIDKRAFLDCTNLKVFSGNVSKFPANSFYNCISLTTVDTTSAEFSVGDRAFKNCNSLKDINVKAIKVYGKESFYGCRALDKVSFNDEVRVLPDRVFMGCAALKFDVLPSGLTEVGSRSFADCKKIDNVNIGAEVKNIGRNAFVNCVGIKTLSIGDYSQVSKNFKSALWRNFGKNLKAVSIGGMAVVPDRCFDGLNNLISVTISSPIKEIGEYAFRNCSGLTELSFVGNCEIIGKGAFENCSKVERISFEDLSIKSVEKDAYKNCSSMKSIYIPSTAVEISEEAFSGCSGLEYVTIPNSVKKIGRKTFFGCENIKSISLAYFDGISKLSDYFDQKTLSMVESVLYDNSSVIPKSFFDGCTALKNLTLTKRVDEIGERAFAECYSLSDFGFATAASSLGVESFKNCTSMSVFPFSERLKEIPASAFEGCVGVSSALKIGNNITKIGERAFKNCAGINEITIESAATDISSDAFSGLNRVGSISVDVSEKSLRDSFGADVCNNVSIVKAGFGKRTDIPDGYFASLTKMTVLNIDGNIESIGASAFENCTSLESFDIPSTVTKIDSRAFANCFGLTRVSIPQTVKTVGKNIFGGCTGLKTLSVPVADSQDFGSYVDNDCLSGITVELMTSDVPDRYFKGFSNLRSFDFGGVQRIGDEAFDSTGLLSVKFTSSVYIGAGAFSNCRSLLSVEFGQQSRIEDSTFANCDHLSAVGGLESVQTIGKFAFDGCKQMRSLVFSEALRSIGDYAFRGCDTYTEIDIPSSVTKIGKCLFGERSGFSSFTVPIADTNDFGRYVSPDSGTRCLTVKLRSDNVPDGYFNGFKQVETYDFSEVRTIGKQAFRGTNLNYVRLGDKTTELGVGAFGNIARLNEVELKNVLCLPESVFENCVSLHTVKGDGFTEIGDSAFKGCKNLSEISIKNCKSIGNGAFENCNAVSFGKIASFEYIGERAFANCYKISELEVDTNEYSVGEKAFIGVNTIERVKFLSFPTEKPFYYLGDNKVSNFEINGVESIDKEFFTKCSGIKILTVKGNISRINNDAFSGMKKLIIINLPMTVKEIGDRAFKNCTDLTTITISGVKYIGDYAFKNCNKLKNVVLPDGVEYIGKKAFAETVNIDNSDNDNQLHFSQWNEYWHYNGRTTFLSTMDNIAEWMDDNLVVVIMLAVVVAAVIALSVVRFVKSKKTRK